MPQVNVSLKKGANADQLDAAKKHVTDKGGKIVREFTLVKGFTAELPDDQISTLQQTNQDVTVEKDGEVTTQMNPIS